MDKSKITEIVKDPTVKSNKDLTECLSFLSKEFEVTKESIVLLTRYLDTIESSYDTVNKELGNRTIKP